MDEDIKIPHQLKPSVCKFHDDLSAVLTDYENGIVSAEGLYDFMIALQIELGSIIFND